MPKKVRADVGESLRDGLAILAWKRELSINQYARQVVLATIRGELARLRAVMPPADSAPAGDDRLSAEKSGIDIDFVLDDEDFRALDPLARAQDMLVGEYLCWLLSVHVFGYWHAARIALHATHAPGK